jgi:5-methylcytosine-specific restriction protein A
VSDPYYQTPEWRALRAAVLRRDPLCKTPGCGRASEHADHIIPRAKGGADAMFNLRGLCEGCHNSRTARGNGELRRVIGCDARGLPTDPADPWWQP